MSDPMDKITSLTCTDMEGSQALALADKRYEELEERYRALKLHTGQINALRSAAAEMMKQDSLAHLLEFIASEIVRLTCANGAYMHMVHETSDYLKVVASCGDLAAQLMGNTRKRGFGLSAQAWGSGEYKYTDNYNDLASRVVEFPEALKAVAVPLEFSDRISGVAFVTASLSEDLRSQIPLLQEFSKIAALAIYYKEQMEIQEQELRRMKALSDLGENLYQATDWDRALQCVSEHLFEIFDLKRVSIYENKNHDDVLISHGSRVKTNGIIEWVASPNPRLATESIVSWSFNNRQFAQVNRHMDDERESPAIHEFRRDNAIGSTMAVPISYADQPWGVILVAKNIGKKDFTESENDVFQTIASLVSTALQRTDLLNKVQHQAAHDSLTNLPNRRTFKNKFNMLTSVFNSSKFALLFCDLDGFKAINDTHGHSVGDQVLKLCAERLGRCIRRDDYLARMGGDEFAILVNVSDRESDVTELAARFIDVLKKPLQVGDLKLHLGASVGVSFFPDDGRSFSELLNHADVAMYQAKNSSGNRVNLFNKKDADVIRTKTELRSAMLDALENNEFELWYQPQVSWREQRVIGLEALVRWNHPERGMVPPFQFIPVAEESGMIEPLGLWIFEEAVRSLKKLQMKRASSIAMGINIAPPQFINKQFASTALSIIEKYGVNPSSIKVEITESFIMQDRDAVVTQLKQLRDAGIVIAIDDFGTGYSSLSYLQDLPIDVLKVDRAFVNVLTEENYSHSIAGSIMALANSLGLDTIIEGVEDEHQLELVKLLGGENIQGYLYSKPVPESEVTKTIATIESGSFLKSA